MQTTIRFHRVALAAQYAWFRYRHPRGYAAVQRRLSEEVTRG